MRVLPRILLATSLCFGFALNPGCKKSGTSNTDVAKPGKPKRKPGMPKPYRLPAKPELAVHVAAPAEAIAASKGYAPGLLPSHRALIQTALAATPSDFDKKVSAFVDTGKPWSAAVVDGQQIVWVPIRAAKKAELAGLLAPKPPEGKFGAVNLQRTGPGAKIAWLDGDTGYLALADDLRGIATARELPHQYGKHGVFMSVNAEQAKRFTGQAPFSRLTIEGAGANDFTLVTEDTNTSEIPDLNKLTEGALTGMLRSEQMALGVSSRYADHASWVKKTLGNAKRQIDKQSFLVRGNLENLHRRGASVLRSWDGRVVAGVGPSRHLLLAFGSSDPRKMGGATHHLIEGIRDNISMARQFGINIPKVRFAKVKTKAAGYNIAAVALQSAKKVVPKEYWGLLDDRGELRIAMAFAPEHGGGLFVVGGKAEGVLGKWLTQIKGAPGSDATAKDFVAATFAVDTKTMASLGSGDLSRLTSQLLKLNAAQEPTSVVVQRDDARYEVKVKGPKIKASAPPPPRAASARRVPRASGRKPSTAKPGTGKPTRAPSRAKPTRG
ncbi:MAG: hypothetical protein AAF721_39835 [Myxococcota bacterium]